MGKVISTILEILPFFFIWFFIFRSSLFKEIMANVFDIDLDRGKKEKEKKKEKERRKQQAIEDELFGKPRKSRAHFSGHRNPPPPPKPRQIGSTFESDIDRMRRILNGDKLVGERLKNPSRVGKVTIDPIEDIKKNKFKKGVDPDFL